MHGSLKKENIFLASNGRIYHTRSKRPLVKMICTLNVTLEIIAMLSTIHGLFSAYLPHNAFIQQVLRWDNG